jgi:Mg-chelatase subunit ChlD
VRGPITTSGTSLAVAIADLAATGGGDAPEAYSGALRYALAAQAVGWRDQTRRFVVVLGDSVPRDDDLNEGVAAPAVPGVWAPGVPARWLDSGLDWAPYTADDADWQATLDLLAHEGVVLLAGVSGAAPLELAGNPDGLARYWDAWAGRTGGRAVRLGQLAELPATLAALVARSDTHIARLAPVVTPAERAAWVGAMPAEYVAVDVPEGGTTRRFDLTIEAPGDAPAGRYTLEVAAVADGARYAMVALEVEWANPCAGAPTPGVTPSEPAPSATAIEPTPAGTSSPPATAPASATATPTATPSATAPTPAASVAPPSPTATPPDTAPAPRPSTLYLPRADSRACLPGRTPAVEVVLLVDASSSMTGAKIDGARAAVTAFVAELRLPRDRAAIVAFHARAEVLAPLTGERGAITAGLERLTLGEGTRIDRALAAGQELLASSARPGAIRALILLTDGLPEGGTAELALAAARAARAAGTALVAVGLGGDVDAPFLRSLTGDPAAVYLAPAPGDLARIYQRLAALIPCGG